MNLMGVYDPMFLMKETKRSLSCDGFMKRVEVITCLFVMIVCKSMSLQNAYAATSFVMKVNVMMVCLTVFICGCFDERL